MKIFFFFFKKKENWVILVNSIDILVRFYWKSEILVAGLRNVTKLQGQWWKSVTRVRSGKFPRFRFSPNCPYYHWLPSYCTKHYIRYFQFAQEDSRSSAVIFLPCPCHVWMVKQNNPICTSQKPPGTKESLAMCENRLSAPCDDGFPFLTLIKLIGIFSLCLCWKLKLLLLCRVF